MKPVSIAFVMMALAWPMQALAGPMCGDVNGDGRVDVTDATSLISYLLGTNSAVEVGNADVNRDGRVDITDATLLISHLLGNYDFPPMEEEFDVNGVSFVMVPVEGGTFMMGATAEQGSDASSRERPVHEVTVSSFYIGQTEVTQELWFAVMGNYPSYFGGLDHPVESVSWEDCQQFIATLNALTGRNFRLPREAEWEFAARGGNASRGYKYSGSNDLSSVGWYAYNDSWEFRGEGAYGTHAVATLMPNELMLYDMSGNVHEWCNDWYGGYSSGSQIDPTGPATGSARVYRGGSWYFDEWFSRVSFRNSNVPTYTSYGIGLRLAFGN